VTTEFYDASEGSTKVSLLTLLTRN